jgi:hypothetical protein
MNKQDLGGLCQAANYLIFLKKNQKLFAKNIKMPLWGNVNKSLGARTKKIVLNILKPYGYIMAYKVRSTRWRPGSIQFRMEANISKYITDKTGLDINDLMRNGDTDNLADLESAKGQEIATKYNLNNDYFGHYLSSLTFQYTVKITSERESDELHIPILHTGYDDEIHRFCLACMEYMQFLCEQIVKLADERLKRVGKKKEADAKATKNVKIGLIDDTQKILDSLMNGLNLNYITEPLLYPFDTTTDDPLPMPNMTLNALQNTSRSFRHNQSNEEIQRRLDEIHARRHRGE